MATAILKEIFQVELIRTRDKKTLDELDIVYDVGGGEFDHHGVEKVYREDGIPFASSGLIWNEFGKEIVRLKDENLSEEEIQSVVSYIDRSLIEAIDAMDNGIRMCDEEIPIMNISGVIAGFNPPWNSENKEDEAFYEAVEVAIAILRNKINYKLSVIKCREIVEKAYENRKIPQLLVLDGYCPYGDVLKEVDENQEVFFVVFKSKSNYTLQTVRGSNGEDRKKLPKAWLGKRDEELAAVTGVSDSVFCHTGRFIAVAGSFEGIMKLAQLAINEPEKSEARGFLEFIKRLFS